MYIPIYMQGVYGGTATNSGLILLPYIFGMVVTSVVGGLMAKVTSYRNIMILSLVVFTVGLILLSTLSTDTSRLLVNFYMLITGLGIGFSLSVISMAVIHHFDETQRGSANAMINFVRILGMTLGITVFGMIQKHIFSDRLRKSLDHASESFNIADTRSILSPEGRAHLPKAILDKITAALSTSTVHIFMWALIPTALAILFVLLMGKERLELNSSSESAGH